MDIFPTNCAVKICKTAQYPAASISDHDIIGLAFRASVPLRQSEPISFQYSDYNAVNREELIASAHDIDWESLRFIEEVDDKVEFLYNQIRFLH